MTTGLSQQQTVASKVERLVERAMTLAVDEHDDDLAVARLAWLAQNDHAALVEAGEVCLEHTEVNLVVRARATGLLARVRLHDLAARPAGGPRPGPAQQPGTARAAGGARPASSSARRRPPRMQTQAMVSYGEWSAVQAGIGGRGDPEGATANMSTEVGDLDAALYQLSLEQFVATRDQTGPTPAGRRRPRQRPPGRRVAASAGERLGGQPARTRHPERGG
jgi:hypothetical protein